MLNDDDGSLTGLIANPDGPKGAERETISVNFDSYFDAPIEAVECDSDIANPPAGFPAGTAKTSPYEYLTTAVYPACARLDGPKPPRDGARMRLRLPSDPVSPEPLQNPNWWSDCTNGTLLRRPALPPRTDQRGADSAATQAIRMMGANLWQRSTLTANNGVYYIDTAAGPAKQAASPNKNIFEANRTYYVLFVYATPTHASGISALRRHGPRPGLRRERTSSSRVCSPAPAISSSPTIADLAAGMGARVRSRQRHPDGDDRHGIRQFKTEFAQAQQNFCQPASFCTFGKKGCQCNPDGAFAKLCKDCDPDGDSAKPCKDKDLCAKWAGKDIDWPDGGVYAFGVTFPSADNFVAGRSGPSADRSAGGMPAPDRPRAGTRR